MPDYTINMKLFRTAIMIVLILSADIPLLAEQSASSLYLGLRGGVHFDGLSDYQPNDSLLFKKITPQLSIGSNLGCFLDVRIWNNLYFHTGIHRAVIRPEWNITTNLMSKTDEGFRVLQNPENVVRNLTYNELPLGLKYRTKNYYIFGTVNFAFIDSAYAIENIDSEELKYSLQDNFVSKFRSIECGIGARFQRGTATSSWFVELAYNHSTADLLKIDDHFFKSMVPGGIKIRVGYEIGLRQLVRSGGSK